MSTKRSLGDRPGTAGGERLCEYIYVEGPVDAVLHFASPASPRTIWNTRSPESRR